MTIRLNSHPRYGKISSSTIVDGPLPSMGWHDLTFSIAGTPWWVPFRNEYCVVGVHFASDGSGRRSVHGVNDIDSWLVLLSNWHLARSFGLADVFTQTMEVGQRGRTISCPTYLGHGRFIPSSVVPNFLRVKLGRCNFQRIWIFYLSWWCGAIWNRAHYEEIKSID